MATHETTYARKGAQNQALIREVNERIEEIAGEVANLEFLCECADRGCVQTIVLSITEYESVRSSPVRFPIKHGHDYPEFERVIEDHERYVVVEKFGEAGDFVEKMDPRSRKR
jgi:hypothetical protein